MNRMIVKSRVGADGVLNVTVPVGPADANREVQVTIEPLAAPPMTSGPPMTPDEWRRFVQSLAGAWQGDFERPPQGQYEQRDPLS
jgi:hypothetical protein